MVKKILDLTYCIEEGMTTFGAPWHPLVSIQQVGRHGFEGRETRKVEFGTHTGTHMDAPLHFVSQGAGIDAIPLERMVGEVAIVDFSHLKENEAITRGMLENIPIMKRMLFRFGWGRHWNTKKFYRDYPFFSTEAAEYLVSKKVEMVCMDTPSPDDSRAKLGGGDEDSPVHKIFLRNGVVLVEYVANLDKVDPLPGWSIIVLPLKIKGADGSPVRACLYK